MGRLKIAVVGTGIAGNVAAWHLNKSHDVTVYEANGYVGGHTNTVNVPTRDGELPVDTGFIVFNDRTYPNFLNLLNGLDVPWQNSEMSFSVRAPRASLEYNGSNLNGLFAQRRNVARPSFIRMIREILKFNREAPRLLDEPAGEQTLGDYLEENGYGSAFIEHYLVPMGAAIWSAEPEMMREMPAHFFVRFFSNHGLLSLQNRPQWRVIQGGSREYVKKLTAGHRDRIRLNCPVQSIRRLPDKVIVSAQGVPTESYDYVFLACHSDQALKMLADATSTESSVLGAIPYQRNEAVLHTDASLMPKRRRAWASWNYHLPTDDNRRVTLTYHMNRLQGLNTEKDYFVTLNSNGLIRPESVIRTIQYDHPIFTTDGVNAQARHHEIDGVHRTYFCGAYWRYGFHEDGVVSALAALDHFAKRPRHAQQHLQRAS